MRRKAQLSCNLEKFKPNRLNMFRRLINFFHENEIEYCVVGMTESLSERIESDIDIVVSSNSLSRVIDLMFEFSEQSRDLAIVQIIQHEQTAFYLVLVSTEEYYQPVFLHPDICGDYFRYGRLFLKSEEMLKNRLLPDGERFFYIAEPAIEFIYYLLKRIDKNNLNETHFEHLKAAFSKNIEYSEKYLSRFWSGESKRILLKSFQTSDHQLLEKNISFLKKNINLPSSSLSICLWEFLRKAGRFLHLSGFWVSFLGPDGCGKSSVSQQVEEQLSPVFRSARWMHLHPRLGQRIPRETSAPNMQPHAKKPRGLLFSALKQCYYLLDYIVGYWLLVYPLLVRSTFVLFDRYLIDLEVDPKRFRFLGPLWLVKLFGFLVPRPDRFFLLDAPTTVLQQRKQEVSTEETERQRIVYQKWAAQTKKCHVLDAARPLHEVVRDCNQFVLEAMAQRTKQRFYHG